MNLKEFEVSLNSHNLQVVDLVIQQQTINSDLSNINITLQAIRLQMTTMEAKIDEFLKKKATASSPAITSIEDGSLQWEESSDRIPTIEENESVVVIAKETEVVKCDETVDNMDEDSAVTQEKEGIITKSGMLQTPLCQNQVPLAFELLDTDVSISSAKRGTNHHSLSQMEGNAEKVDIGKSFVQCSVFDFVQASQLAAKDDFVAKVQVPIAWDAFFCLDSQHNVCLIKLQFHKGSLVSGVQLHDLRFTRQDAGCIALPVAFLIWFTEDILYSLLDGFFHLVKRLLKGLQQHNLQKMRMNNIRVICTVDKVAFIIEEAGAHTLSIDMGGAVWVSTSCGEMQSISTIYQLGKWLHVFSNYQSGEAIFRSVMCYWDTDCLGCLWMLLPCYILTNVARFVLLIRSAPILSWIVSEYTVLVKFLEFLLVDFQSAISSSTPVDKNNEQQYNWGTLQVKNYVWSFLIRSYRYTSYVTIMTFLMGEGSSVACFLGEFSAATSVDHNARRFHLYYWCFDPGTSGSKLNWYLQVRKLMGSLFGDNVLNSSTDICVISNSRVVLWILIREMHYIAKDEFVSTVEVHIAWDFGIMNTNCHNLIRYCLGGEVTVWYARRRYLPDGVATRAVEHMCLYYKVASKQKGKLEEENKAATIVSVLSNRVGSSEIRMQNALVLVGINILSQVGSPSNVTPTTSGLCST